MNIVNELPCGRSEVFSYAEHKEDHPHLSPDLRTLPQLVEAGEAKVTKNPSGGVIVQYKCPTPGCEAVVERVLGNGLGFGILVGGEGFQKDRGLTEDLVLDGLEEQLKKMD